MKKGIIYKIENLKNNSIYIGFTINSLKKRFKEHSCKCFKTNLNTKLCNSMRKYGIENFKIEQIEECPIENLNSREIEIIKEYNTFKNGLNSTQGGEGSIGYKHSPEIRLKISDNLKHKSRKGKTYDEIYGDNAKIEKEKRKMNGKKYWENISDEEKAKRISNLKKAVRKNPKYPIETIMDIKKLINEGIKPTEIHKKYPDVKISMIYCIRSGTRWKD